MDCTNWDGRLIHTVSSLDVDYMLCETVPDKKTDKPRKFKLKADKDSAIITMKVAKMYHQVKVKIVQFGVISNKATTGHKLQGVSLNQMLVRSWNYRTPNWIYVVLSRVRTLNRLFICEKLNHTKKISKLTKIY